MKLGAWLLGALLASLSVSGGTVDSTGPAARKARQTRRRAGTVMGDVVEYHMRKLAHRRTMWWFRGEAMVAGQLVAEAELGAMIADE